MNSCSNENFYQHVQNLNTLQLFEIVKNLKREVERTKMENLWIENYFREHAPHVLNNIIRLAERSNVSIKPSKLFQKSSQFITELTLSRASRESRAFSKRRITNIRSTITESSTKTVSSALKNVPVSYVIKTEFCDKTANKMSTETNKMSKKSAQTMEHLKAETQELALCSEEYLNTIKEFEIFVIERGYDPITKRINAEIFTKFLRELVHSGNVQIESNRLKKTTMQTNCNKSKKMLKMREEISGCLRAVDFKLMAIEKKSFKKRDEEKKNHYAGLKNSSSDAAIAMTFQQKKLLNITQKYNKLLFNSNHCEKIIKTLEKQLIVQQEDVVKVQHFNSVLSKKIMNYEAPTIMEYITKLNILEELKRQLKFTYRQANIALIEHKNIKKILKSYKAFNNNFPF